MEIKEYARKKLGLGWSEADFLFAFNNTREMIQEQAEQIARRKGETL